MAPKGDKEVKKKRATAEKRNLQSEKRRQINKIFRSRFRTSVRAFFSALKQSDQNARQNALNEAFSLVDKGVNKGIFKKNKASRTKERLMAKLHATQAV